jgi:hypothetical protein
LSPAPQVTITGDVQPSGEAALKHFRTIYGSPQLQAFHASDSATLSFHPCDEYPAFRFNAELIIRPHFSAAGVITWTHATARGGAVTPLYVAMPYKVYDGGSITKYTAAVLGLTAEQEPNSTARTETWGSVDLVTSTSASKGAFPELLYKCLDAAMAGPSLLVIIGKHPTRPLQPHYNASLYVDSAVIAKVDQGMPQYPAWYNAALRYINIQEGRSAPADLPNPGDSAALVQDTAFWQAATTSPDLQPGATDDAKITIVAPDNPFVDGATLVPAVVHMRGVKYPAGIDDINVINCIPNVAPLSVSLTTANEETIDAIAEAAAQPFHADIVYAVHGRLLMLTSLKPRN